MWRCVVSGKAREILSYFEKNNIRIATTTASSATSERDFSDVNRILVPERSRLYPALLNEVLFLKSYEKMCDI